MSKGKKQNNLNWDLFSDESYDDTYDDMELEEGDKTKNLKLHSYGDNGRKPQWRADRRQAKRLKEQRMGIKEE